MSSLLNKRRQTQTNFEKVERQVNSAFITNGYPSINITSEDGKNNRQAVVINKQQSDDAYILTPYKKPLQVGSVWGAKGLYWLIAEEIVIIKDVNWRKYYCYLCNNTIKDKHVFFYGPGKSRINVNLKENTFLLSSNEPVLVAGGALALAINDTFLIKNQAWKVQEYDNLSQENITYYTLARSTISKDTKIERPAKSILPFDNIGGDQDADLKTEGELPLDTPVYIQPGKSFTLSGDSSYTVSDAAAIKLVSRTATSFTFQLQPNVNKVSITIGGAVYTYTSVRKE